MVVFLYQIGGGAKLSLQDDGRRIHAEEIVDNWDDACDLAVAWALAHDCEIRARALYSCLMHRVEAKGYTVRISAL